MKKWWFNNVFRHWCVRNWHVYWTKKAFRIEFANLSFEFNEVLFDGKQYHISLGNTYFKNIGFTYNKNIKGVL